MSLSTIKRLTTNYSFRIPVFDSPNWGRDIENNFDTIDAVLFAVTGFANIKGVWAFETAYAIGDRIIDSTDGTLWECLVAHTSWGEGTFEEYRTDEPTHWQNLNLLPSYRGAWTTGTAYVAYQFLYDSARFGVTTRAFTSGANYNADVSNGDIITLIDLSAYVIPSPTVALNFIRANAGTTAYELRTPAQVRADIGADNASNITSGTLAYARLPSTAQFAWASSSASTDWNDVTTIGTHNVALRGDNTNGPTPSVAAWYNIIVMGSTGGGVFTQIAIPTYGTSNYSWFLRSYATSTWSAWREIPTKSYLDTLYVGLTGAQTVAGAKTFSGAGSFTSTLSVTGAATFLASLTLTGNFVNSGSVTTKGGTQNVWAANATANAHTYYRDDTGVQRALCYWSYSVDRLYWQVYDNAGTLIGTNFNFDGTDLRISSAEVLTHSNSKNLTKGFTSTAYNAGTKSSGTFTPDPANGNLQYAVNGGAHTLAAPTATGDYSIVIQYTNNGSAGAITLSGFTLTNGDTLTTTNGHDFFLHIVKINGFVRVSVEALQ